MKRQALFVVCAVLLLIFFATNGGACMRKNYEEPWDKEYHLKFSDIRLQVASIALLAPNGHNMQPWIIKLDPQDKQTFYLYGDATRLTPDFDPSARQFVVTQGTFLEYARIAAEKLGYQAQIIPFPDGEYDAAGSVASIQAKPAAKVTLVPAAPVEDALYAAMFLPDTYRGAYEKTPLTDAQVKALEGANNFDGLAVKIVTAPADLQEIGRIALGAATVEAGIQSIGELNCKLFRINDAEKSKYRYGFSLESQGTSGLMLNTMQLMLSLFPSLNNVKSGSDLFINTTKTAVEHTPAYLFINSKDNRRMTQLLAGMLYARLLLVAHTQDLVMQPLSQAIEEYPAVQDYYRQVHREYAGEGETIQMLLRVGRTTVSIPTSMRRDVMELVQ